MRYGSFDDQRREYVITRPDTPLPWINYLGCEKYLGLISNTAGGYSFYQDARLRRITRYRYNNVPLDTGGRYIYLRDDESGEFWSPTWQPTRHDLKDYFCRHGLGYTIIGSTYSGIKAENRYFVPLGENLEIWQCTLTNERDAPAALSLFSSVEFCLWDANDDATNFQRNFSIGEVEVEDEPAGTSAVIYHKTEYRERRDHFAFFACSEKPGGFDTQREAFLGAYRGWDRPRVVERGQSANSVAHGWSPIGSFHLRVALEPGESRTVHQYQPLTKRGNDAVGSGFNDDPHWLVFCVAAYLQESGDWSILDEWVPYDNQPGSETPLYEHLQRCLRYTEERLGPHGLPLIGRADWNDCLNLNCFSTEPGQSFQTTTNKEGKVAESVLIGAMYVLSAQEMAAIASARPGATDGEDQAAHYRAAAAQMTATVLAHGWDGDWFLRAYDDFGNVVGSNQCEEGQIFIEPQGFCALAGIGVEDGKLAQAIDAVHERLATPHGILLLQPAFSQYYLHLGEISSYPPGYKENASVFCHTNPWIMIAETILGHGDQAHDYYTRINPSAREAISDVHRSEPYVYAQMIAGRDAPTQGEAKNSWLSGTAAWNYVAIAQWILGIRPTYRGLQIAPVIPTDWPGFTATRVFRNVTYHIEITRSGPGNEVSLSVDGEPVAGTIVPIPRDDTTEVEVKVTLA